jgi:hypothetical protein
MEGVVSVAPRLLYIGQRSLGAHRIRRWVGPEAGVDVLPKKTCRVQSLFRLRSLSLCKVTHLPFTRFRIYNYRHEIWATDVCVLTDKRSLEIFEIWRCSLIGGQTVDFERCQGDGWNQSAGGASCRLCVFRNAAT